MDNIDTLVKLKQIDDLIIAIAEAESQLNKALIMALDERSAKLRGFRKSKNR